MSFTKAQKEFIESLTPPDGFTGEEYWECFAHERRTAMSLAKRGVVEFEDIDEVKFNDTFMARLTTEYLSPGGHREK